MKDTANERLENIKGLLKEKGVYFDELPNGQIKVDTVNYWVTSEKFYDTKTNDKGQGTNSFLEYLRSKNIIRNDINKNDSNRNNISKSASSSSSNNKKGDWEEIADMFIIKIIEKGLSKEDVEKVLDRVRKEIR